MKLTSISSKIILDSRGEKTIETTVTYEKVAAQASVPCGKSKGEYEAFSHTPEYSQKLIEELKPQILKEGFVDQEKFDQFLINLDGTENKKRLGVNVTLSLSIAFLRLYSSLNKTELFQTIANLANTKPEKQPLLFFNLINGGLHVEKKFSPLPFQEYLVIPKNLSAKESLDLVFKFIESLKSHLIKTGIGIKYGDEGGFVVTGEDPEIGLQHFQEVAKSDRNFFFGKVSFGLDAASSSMWDGTANIYDWDNGLSQRKWDDKMLSKIYKSLITKYPLLSIEDPFHQNSWIEWANLNHSVGKKVWVVGDDLTVTNVRRIAKANKHKSANAVLIKPNQIGTVTETLNAVKLAKSYDWKIIVSHRSGETKDDFIADLAFGVGADGLKSGSPLQEERLAKYQRLVEIESSYRQENVG